MIHNEFFVPDSLSGHIDETIVDSHERLAQQSLDDFWGSMPLSNLPVDNRFAAFVDVTPSEDHDRKHAVVLPLPFANGWAPHTAMRAKLMQDSLDEATRVIVLPNDSNSYELSKYERTIVASGNFEPIVEKQLRSLESAGIESFSIIGYSQGASIGACALKLSATYGDFKLGNSGLFEAPNVVGRKPGELRGQFIKSGKGLDKAVNDSAIPALSEAQKSRGGLDVIRKNIGLLPFVVRSQSATNRAIHKGFTYPKFWSDLDSALSRNGGFDVSLVSALSSLITPHAFVEEAAKRYGNHPRITRRIVEGYGHEMGDNIVVHAILARLAIEGSTQPK